VRVGVANQRTVLRTLELPPITDAKELAAAVTFQAQDQVPMPLNNAVLDFHPLGVVDTPAGARQRVVVVAAQKDMIERLLGAVRRAGLRPEGVDLSAFALIRALHRHDPEAQRVLYLNVDGLTNLAIADGTVCRFTRVVGGGLESMAIQVAERRGIALAEARELVRSVDLRKPPVEEEPPAPRSVPTAPLPEPADAPDLVAEAQLAAGDFDHEDTAFLERLADDEVDESPVEPLVDAAVDVWNVLDGGIRDISGEVRNSLDFHRSQEGGGEVSYVVLSGAAEAIPGFAQALEQSLRVPVRGHAVAVGSGALAEEVSAHRLAVAAGLATREAPQ
jgi:type IV pilus assembly protein PilM